MTPNEEDKIAIQEINQHISDALRQWADVVVTADSDGWAYLLNYTDEDIVNALWLINSILQNVAIKSGHIDFDNAIAKSNDTASYRMIIDDLLKELLMNNFISLEMYLEHASFPFADKILQSVRAQRQHMAESGQMPSQEDMNAIAQMAQQTVPQNEQGMQQAQQLTRGFNPNAA